MHNVSSRMRFLIIPSAIKLLRKLQKVKHEKTALVSYVLKST